MFNDLQDESGTLHCGMCRVPWSIRKTYAVFGCLLCSKACWLQPGPYRPVAPDCMAGRYQTAWRCWP